MTPQDARSRIAPVLDSGPGANGHATTSASARFLRWFPSRPQWRVFMAVALSVLFHVITKAALGVVYFAVIAEGLRVVMPALGMKLYKIPGLSVLQDFEGTFRLDLAHCLSIFLLIAVWMLWTKILEMWLECDESFQNSTWNATNHRRLIIVLGSVILFSDAFLFYVAVVELGWTGSSLSFTALVVTSAYLGVIISMTYIGILLDQNVRNRKEELQSCA